jgi:outer membrane protein assembly factor BamB
MLTPQVVQDVLCGSYTGVESNQSVLFALNASSGEPLWTLTYPNQIFAMETAGAIIYVAGNDGMSAGGPFGTGLLLSFPP